MTKWKLVPVEPTYEMIGEFVNALLIDGPTWQDATPDGRTECMSLMAPALLSMLEAAPQPPKLSDERIREIWIEHGLDDEDVEEFARAIEREILGGEHE